LVEQACKVENNAVITFSLFPDDIINEKIVFIFLYEGVMVCTFMESFIDGAYCLEARKYLTIIFYKHLENHSRNVKNST